MLIKVLRNLLGLSFAFVIASAVLLMVGLVGVLAGCIVALLPPNNYPDFIAPCMMLAFAAGCCGLLGAAIGWLVAASIEGLSR